MITFLDENDVEYGALATIKATNAVNGERSLTGTIASGDYVLSNIERGWRLRFDDEYYVVTFAKPIDEGRDVQVEFDAVHQFFWDFDKSSVYDQLSDGSHTFVAYLDFIFKNSGYSYTVDSALNVHAFEKQSFGFKKRLSLFNDIITSTGVEFQANGKVVRILEKVGTDLSTVVRKNFNMNELTIEKNIGDFVTYQKGFGAYFDEEDHSKGRLEVEYTSPLASVYGRLEAEPFVDERYSQSSSLLAALKENVDNSYTISVSLDMEDLTRAGYKYKQPVAGDYIMAINETLGFKEKIRIVSFASEYDVDGQLIKHTVTCNDIGSVKKLSASYTHTQHQAANAEANANTAYEFANKALISADGKNTNYYGDSFPVDNPKGTLKKGDLLFLTVGDTVKQYYWNGADWVINPVLDDVEAFKEQIAEELKDVPNREEFENKIAEELATSKAEIETQIESAKTQAESNAKEYADTINQETAKVAEQASTAADEIKADLVNVKNNLTSTSIVANNAQAAVDAAKQELTNVNTKVDNAKAELTQAKQDLISHAQQLQTQANSQTELTKRVTTVETTANGTKTTVNELTKTVAQNGKDITSVTNRTKTVEDDLAGTKTTLTQVQTTANSASQKTATLETGLNGLSAKFDNLKIGGRNLLVKTNQGKANWAWSVSKGSWSAETVDVDGISAVKLTRTSAETSSWSVVEYHGLIRNLIESDTDYTLSFDAYPNVDVTFIATLVRGDSQASLTNSKPMNTALANQWTKVRTTLHSLQTLPEESGQLVYLSGMPCQLGNYLIIKNIKLEKGNVATDYSPSEVDLEQKVAEYRQNADQNYASLQTTVQNLDGTVKQNKSEFDQTASQIRSSISSVEGKIPTEIGGVNLLRNSKGPFKPNRGVVDNYVYYDSSTVYLEKNQSYVISGLTDGEFSGTHEPNQESNSVVLWLTDRSKGINRVVSDSNTGNNGTRFTWEIDTGTYCLRVNTYKKVADKSAWNIQVEKGNVKSDYAQSPLDTDADITKVSSEIQQTKDGMTLLATKTELNTAKSDLQSGINTATNKANSAQNTANSAQNKANSNAQTISTHTNQISALNTGLSAKVSQSDFNTLSGRVTTAENNITAKANELSSKISSVEGKVMASVGGRNLWIQSKATGQFVEETLPDNHITGQKKCYCIPNYQQLEFNIEPDFSPRLYQKVTFSAWVKYENVVQGDNAWNKFNCFKHELCYKNSSTGATTDSSTLTLGDFTGTSDWKHITYTYDYAANKSYDQLKTSLRFNLEGTKSGTAWVAGIKVEIGSIPSDYSPAPEDTAEQISSLSSEFKQTTDAIKASVSSLDSSTVKSSSLTINADGIVMKAGKSTTDVANAIGSYFAVNQNAINLFSDKINVKGNMIVSGAITSDKIASKSINTAHLNGKIITADVISSNAVTANAIKAGAVTTDKMSANSINGDRIAAGTLDAAKIKAGSITASQIASGTITSNQIKAGGISAANIAAGAITTDKIAAGAIDANKIAANALTANMIKGGQLNSTNGATVFDLNAGTLTFNNNYGYIQRIASDKVFEITTHLSTSSGSQEYLTSAFNIRKSDNSRQAGVKFTLYNTVENKPTAEAKMNADALILYDSINTRLFSVHGKSTFAGGINIQGWEDIPIAKVHGGLVVNDIGIGSHTKSLLKIVEELCKKAGILWV